MQTVKRLVDAGVRLWWVRGEERCIGGAQVFRAVKVFCVVL